MRQDHQHYVPTPPAPGVAAPVQSILRENKLLQDADHLSEHLRGIFSDEQLSAMSAADREFHYFKLHDNDNNERLDGLEMLNAIGHVVEADHDLILGHRPPESLTPDESRKLQKARLRHQHHMAYIYDMVDRMLVESDKDKDGYISYAEYVGARR